MNVEPFKIYKTMAYEVRYKKYADKSSIQQTKVINDESLRLYKQEYYRNDDYLHIKPLEKREYGRKLFLVCDGKLRQFMFLKSIFFPFITQHGYRNFTEMYERQRVDVLRVAGIGDVYAVSTRHDSCSFTIFKSIDDYKNGIEYIPNICADVRDEVVESLRQMFEVESSGDIYYYKWNGAQVVRCSISNAPHYVEYGKNGVSLDEEFLSEWADRTDIYKSAKECSDSNEIQIELLDDDDYAEQEKTFKVKVLGVDCDATEKELRNAIKVISKTLGNGVLK